MPSAAEPILVTADLPGTGGRFKAMPEDFEVTERPLYEPEGEGEHLYLLIRRRGLNTRDLVKRIARIADCNPRDIGHAGLKDRQAVATQTFSVAVKPAEEEAFLAAMNEREDFEVLAAKRHRNKLGRGHLVGNHFKIRVRDTAAGAADHARAILARLEGQGLPNFFGPQRYGNDGMNADRGAALLEGGRERDRFLRELYLHAWQSRAFDTWLGRRIERGDWKTVIAGDIARIEGRGGLFLVEDASIEAPRAERGEISATGPMFGGKMMMAADAALEVEKSVAPPEAFDTKLLSGLRLPGSRRAARVFPSEMAVTDEGEGTIVLDFALPKGSYATSVLREVMKVETEAEIRESDD